MNVQQNSLENESVASMDRHRILCVDDDIDITRSIEIVLSNYQVDVIRECCGQLGVWDVFEHQPNLIITDLRMPHGDGQLLLEQVKSNTQTAQIPVIVLTGQRDPQLTGRLKNMGAAAILHKPVHVEDLMAEIRRFITLADIEWATANASGVEVN